MKKNEILTGVKEIKNLLEMEPELKGLLEKTGLNTGIVYISGKITGNPDYEKEFYKAELKLRKKGYEVINPAKVGYITPKSFNWQDYMDICEILLKKADAIYMLKGWKESKGATIEREIAIKNGIEIIEEE